MYSGKVFNLQRFCLNDGDGIRTIVFFSGCPLRCKWCQNPEGFVKGDNLTIKQIMAEVLKDKKYYAESGGGVTFSGGEVCMQADFATELANACIKENVPVVIETSGYSNSEAFLKLAKKCSKVYFDIKLLDKAEFTKWTGGDLKIVLNNLELLQKENIKVVIRCPIIGGVNDTESHYRAIGELAKSFSVIQRVELLPYNELCPSKYEKLNMELEYDFYLPNNLVQAKEIIASTCKKEVILW